MVNFVKVLVLISLAVTGKAQFTVQPVSVERAEGLEAVFRCRYQVEGSTVNSKGFDSTYDWSINKETVHAETETVKDLPPLFPGGPATLTIVATPQHNNSVVQCLRNVYNGTVIVRSEGSATAILTVYATVITAVLSAPNTIIVTWNALPSTEYCVDINRTTQDPTETVFPNPVCGSTDQYIFTYSNHSVCDRFSFTVAPTEGEMRGTTSEPDTGFFTRTEGSTEEPHRIRESGENKSVVFKATVPSCTRFTQYRVDSDLLTSINGSITDPLFNGSLSFSLPTDKMTEYSVTLTDENGIDLVFENIPISTFDVQDLIVSECPGGGCISVSIEYVEGTLSPGALVSVIRVLSDNSLDFQSLRLVPIRRNMSDNFTISVADNGIYSVVAFDLENNDMSVPNMPISIVADDETVILSNEFFRKPNSPLCVEDITVTKLSNGSAEVTCNTSGLSCLVLFLSKNSPTSLDPMVMIGFIEPPDDRTVVTLDATSDVYVVVYTWNSDSGETIFDGQVSFITQFELPTTPPPTQSPPDSTESLYPSPLPLVPIGVIVVVPVIAFIVIIVIIIVVLYLVKRVKRYKRDNSNSQGRSTNRASQESDVGAPITPREEVIIPLYDVARPPPPGYDVENTHTSPEGEAAKDSSQGSKVMPTEGEGGGHEENIAAQYPLVVPKPASSDDKVKDLTKVIYSEVDKNKLKPVDPPPVAKTQRLKSQYTLVETKPGSGAAKVVMDSTRIVYSEVDKEKLKLVDSNDPPALPPRRPATNTGELALPPRQRPPPPPPTHETLMALLHIISKKWEDIAKALKFDEDRVDEIFTNNETDYLRLHELVEYYFMNAHCSHSWEEMVRVLTEIEEHALAARIQAEQIQGAEVLQFSSVV